MPRKSKADGKSKAAGDESTANDASTTTEVNDGSKRSTASDSADSPEEVGQATTQGMEILSRIEMSRFHEALAVAGSLENRAQFIRHLLSWHINSE